MTRQELENMQCVHKEMQFGKYKGMRILDVIDKDASYIVWCIKNVKGFVLDEKLVHEMLEQYERHHRNLQNDVPQVLHLMKTYGMHANEAKDFIDNNEMPEHF